jgi:tetratricopeptide (TPR) repeat protein
MNSIEMIHIPMKRVPQWRAIFSSLAVVVLAAGCNQSQISTSVLGTTATSIKQNSWKQLTANADAALKQGNKIEAEQSYNAAMTEAEKLGDNDPAQAEAVANLASFYYVQGEAGRADQLYRRSLALHEKRLGMEHVDLTVDLLGLARVSSSQKKYADASSFYRRAIAILKKAGRSVPPDIEAEYIKVQNFASHKDKQ